MQITSFETGGSFRSDPRVSALKIRSGKREKQLENGETSAENVSQSGQCH